MLHDAFIEHAVLLFRGQHLSAGAQAEFAGRLAVLEASLLDRRSLLLAPALRITSGSPAGEVPLAEASWHADHTHDAEPSLACIAHAAGPAMLAATVAFADQRAALNRLPATLRRRAEELRAEQRHAGLVAEHPVVRSHPVTGEASLFVNPASTNRILNLPTAESDRLIGLLFAAATATPLTWTHAWAPGDLLLWDNRVVLHTGMPVMALQRTRIEGDHPLGLRAYEMPWVVAG